MRCEVIAVGTDLLVSQQKVSTTFTQAVIAVEIHV